MKQIIAGILLLGSLVFGQTGSREGDSLALVAIKKANPGSYIDTLTGADGWVEGNSMAMYPLAVG